MADCTAEAMDLVARHIQGRPVPDPIVTRAVVETAADLFWRKQARAGVVDFGAGSESGPELVHVANDPLRAVRPMLAPYLPGGFA
ncbi:hypothetical protein [Kocuria sp.]|uniref:hypothetical protein n=1 Tax=Kocuria sp. TaxID=1871328 RepID=UPI0026E10A94|nr:hypothetical protein [Kocuria sp.]